MSPSSAAAATYDPFILKRRLLVLVIFCVAIINTTLLVPSKKFSDSLLKTAINVIAVIFCLSVFVVCLLWLCGRVLGGDAYHNNIVADSATAGIAFTYNDLSRRQKKHLDRKRLDGIRRILGSYSMKLAQENIITSSYFEAAESEEILERHIIPKADEEEGGDETRGHSNDAHVMVHISDHTSEDDKNSLTRKGLISCAICLTEYEVSNVVSWSANPKCPHIFHEECITKWFVSLGRLQSVSDLHLEDDCPKNVLGYRLECPCCRQDFILVPE